MPDAAPHPELLRSLGRLVRGLSALFWGLPSALVLGVGTAGAGWFRATWGLPACLFTALLLFGLWQLASFQKQERPWRHAIDRASFFALLNLGLSPFLYFWHGVPEQAYFRLAVCLLAVSSLFFLIALNVVLLRLGAMLPDEALRHELRQYTAVNRSLLTAFLFLTTLYLAVPRILLFYINRLSAKPVDWHGFQIVIPSLGLEVNGSWLLWIPLCLFLLLPIAMTMALIWKTKEVILENVFGGAR
ncbi:MAG: hypothetical protein U1F98_13950 [Verrucomicrobiota bacterium]